MLITVPAYPWMWGPHDVHLHHQRRYTPRSVASACGSAGLGVARITFFNTLLFPLALVARVLERMRGTPGTATRTPGRLANTVLREVFSFERHLLRSYMLLDCDRVVGPAFHRGVVGDDEDFAARHASDTRNQSRARCLVPVHPPRRER